MLPFDVLVVGAGHAGVEAAAAAARRGASVGLATFDRQNIGALSCNPSIGGVGKGHIVREVDAFGGLMARAADGAAIHHRMLNRSKGTAVHGPRVQVDRQLYRQAITRLIEEQGGINLIVGEVNDLHLVDNAIGGVLLAGGSIIAAKTVVLATGTFLQATMFSGADRVDGGRVHERAASTLGRRLREWQLPVSRLKTGTPPRLDGRTIDWRQIARQPSDDEAWTMSALSTRRTCPQVDCGITRTTTETHDIIRRSLDRSPLYSGAIEAGGPRYCPSIEDKVARFGDRDGHQIFLEPEGLEDTAIYPNGISTSLPADAQVALVRSIAGLERADVTALGYAVEYDHIDPRALRPTLEVRKVRGLFCAGQINGTTGYEEAAGQGLIAGLNAAAHALSLDPVMLDRTSSYIGVMIDDLVLQGITEPYRMLTARAEYRLSLRADNAETRLGAVARTTGCLSVPHMEHLEAREKSRAEMGLHFQALVTASELLAAGIAVDQDGRKSLAEWVRVIGADAARCLPAAASRVEAAVTAEMIEDARYAPYLQRQAEEQVRLRRDDGVPLGDGFAYRDVPGLSHEMIERLERVRPGTLGAAGRIAGLTPAALSAIFLHVSRRRAA